MNSRSIRYSLFVVLALVFASPLPASADKCTTLKLKAVAKRQAGLLACTAKSVQLGDNSGEADCVAKVTTKFTAAFAKAGTCNGDASQCEANVDSHCVPAVRDLLDESGPSKCEASRLKAAGKRASGATQCATKKPELQAECQTKVNDKFLASFAKVSGCQGDGEEATVATTIDDDCVDWAVTTDGGGNVTEVCPVVCVSPPAGSYQASCRGCTACRNVLTCSCADGFTNPNNCPGGGCYITSIDLPCAGDIANCGGTLKCGGC